MCLWIRGFYMYVYACWLEHTVSKQHDVCGGHPIHNCCGKLCTCMWFTPARLWRWTYIHMYMSVNIVYCVCSYRPHWLIRLNQLLVIFLASKSNCLIWSLFNNVFNILTQYFGRRVLHVLCTYQREASSTVTRVKTFSLNCWKMDESAKNQGNRNTMK